MTNSVLSLAEIIETELNDRGRVVCCGIIDLTAEFADEFWRFKQPLRLRRKICLGSDFEC